jgi:hypothetical protein
MALPRTFDLPLLFEPQRTRRTFKINHLHTTHVQRGLRNQPGTAPACGATARWLPGQASLLARNSSREFDQFMPWKYLAHVRSESYPLHYIMELFNRRLAKVPVTRDHIGLESVQAAASSRNEIELIG